MNDRIILQIVRRKLQAIEFLVQPFGASWKLISVETVAPNLPIETALRAAEGRYGDESVCALWKLGTIVSGSHQHHIFCLDLESVGAESEPGVDELWLDEDLFFRELPLDFQPLMKKVLLIK